MACQRFVVNVTSLCLFHWKNGYMYFFYGPTIQWEGIGKRFWRRNRINCQRCNINLRTLLVIEKNGLPEVYC